MTDPTTNSAAAAAVGGDPVRVSELTTRCMGNPAIAALLLDKFEKQLNADAKTIDAQLAARDAQQLAKTVHSLKGAAGAVAAPRLHELSASLELLAREDRLDAAVQSVAALKTEIDRCLAYLPQARASVKASTPPGAAA
jgi:HPt (histidine-containing phosphotransfer) domain-containing protein